MRILVTGGTGFIGSHIAEHYLSLGHTVLITGTDAERTLPGVAKYLQPSFLGLDWESLGHIDLLFHEAAINDTQNMDEQEMMRANFLSSQELFRAVVQRGCKHIVYASSTAVYGNLPAPYHEEGPTQPMNPYATSKLLLDEFAMSFSQQHPSLVIVGLRYCNIYGPYESNKGKRSTMIYQLAQQILNGNPRIFHDGEQKRDYLYVKDVVMANVLAAQAKESCIVNCGLGKATTFNRIIEILCTLLKQQRTTEYIHNPYGNNYQSYTECDMTLAKKKLGFVPSYSIEEGISDYYASGHLIKK